MPTNKIPGAPVGIFRCRDLVTLYFGVRMVATLNENLYFISASGQTQQILGQDPRRISYEITFEAGASPGVLYIGNQAQMDASQAAVYRLNGDTIVIARNWFVDLDAVTLPLLARAGSTAPYEIFVREIILTPAGVDEQLLNPFTGAPPR
jgi:hypothetical protein